jgi:hypothetical protein
MKLIKQKDIEYRHRRRSIAGCKSTRHESAHNDREWLLNVLNAIGAQQDKIRYAGTDNLERIATWELVEMFDADSADFIGEPSDVF